MPQGGAALWRLDVDVAGSGVTGDLLAHSIDTAEWLNGPIQRVTAATETFVKERMHAETGKVQPVGIDDACMFLAVFKNGSMGTFESTRYARGRKNFNTFELNGEAGSVYFDLEDPQYLQYFKYADPKTGREDRKPPDRLAEDPRHQLRAPLHEALVGARLHDRLRAHVHQRPGRLPGRFGNRQEDPARLPLRPAHAKSLRRRAGQRQERQVGSRSRQARLHVESPDPCVARVAAGIVRHCGDDAWFHETRAFAELSLELCQMLRRRLPADDGFRPHFLGHILVELLLDAALIAENPARLDAYYAAFDAIDPEVVQDAVNQMSPRPTYNLGAFIRLFSRERFLSDYADDGKLLFRTNQVMRRVGLPLLPARRFDPAGRGPRRGIVSAARKDD